MTLLIQSKVFATTPGSWWNNNSLSFKSPLISEIEFINYSSFNNAEKYPRLATMTSFDISSMLNNNSEFIL